jgi:hypothetical protein
MTQICAKGVLCLRLFCMIFPVEALKLFDQYTVLIL